MDNFQQRNLEMIEKIQSDENFQSINKNWLLNSIKYEHSYHFTWLGLPIIQYSQDIIAIQEIIWKVKPDLIIETGIARGGSIIFYASMLELLGNNGKVLGIDIDIREHNRKSIETHPMFKHIITIEGSSIDEYVVKKVKDYAKHKSRILVVLDSNHTHDHVLKELQYYSPLVTKNSYLIVLDTIIEDLPEELFPHRPWSKGNNPKTAVWEFLEKCDQFEIDKSIEEKLLITVAPDGYLRCVK